MPIILFCTVNISSSIFTLSLHDALPISARGSNLRGCDPQATDQGRGGASTEGRRQGQNQWQGIDFDLVACLRSKRRLVLDLLLEDRIRASYFLGQRSEERRVGKE